MIVIKKGSIVKLVEENEQVKIARDFEIKPVKWNNSSLISQLGNKIIESSYRDIEFEAGESVVNGEIVIK